MCSPLILGWFCRIELRQVLAHTQLSEKATVVHTAPPANRQSKDTRPRVTQLWSPATQTLTAAPDSGFRPHLPFRPWLSPRRLLLPPPPSRRAPRRRPPPPAPRAPPPAPAAGPHIRVPTPASRPDSGTMVMAEGTAVLRRNRPGTKAQVSSPRLSCRGPGGAEPARERSGRGERVGVGASRSRDTRPALPEPPSALEACEARGPGGVRRGPGLEPVPGRCPRRLGTGRASPRPAAGVSGWKHSPAPLRAGLAADVPGRSLVGPGQFVQPDAGGDRWLLPRLFVFATTPSGFPPAAHRSGEFLPPGCDLSRVIPCESPC